MTTFFSSFKILPNSAPVNYCLLTEFQKSACLMPQMHKSQEKKKSLEMQSFASFILNWFCAINEIILWKKKLHSSLWGETEQKNF